MVRKVWSYFLSIFGIFQRSGMEYSKFHYWRSVRPDRSLMDVVRGNMPGIMCWVIWKAYAHNIWGSGGTISSPDVIILQIKTYIQNWVASLKLGKLNFIGNMLFEEYLVPRGFKLKGFKLQLIRWERTQKKWKMNVDASYLSVKASGGAIIRDGNGHFVSAISFPLLAQSPVDAEIKAICFALKWATENGFDDLHIETDSWEALQYIDGKLGRRWAS
ncbi:unnamed protein product [Cuscuta epithymum]|uniref:RNase H type-1 domain-containing protein n=1 Tax=Cuscuta epithymum TaxID=186058 RepID=A0AAV0GKX4_9ASTE|nr:unnamed protein product [Cuscuta epithymum]